MQTKLLLYTKLDTTTATQGNKTTGISTDDEI